MPQLIGRILNQAQLIGKLPPRRDLRGRIMNEDACEMTERDECEFFEGLVGDDLSIPIQLLDVDGNPEKLAVGDGVTEIVGEFRDGNGAVTPLTLTDGKVIRVDETCGRISITVTAAISATLKSSRTVKQTFTVYRVKGGLKRTWEFENQLLLKPRPVPAT